MSTTKTQQKKTSSSSTSSSTNTTSTNASSSRRSSGGRAFVGGFMNILAFVAVCVGGFAMFLAMVLGWFGLKATWIASMQAIANAIGWLALCLLSINYIRRKRRLGIWIVWVIAIVMIFTGIIMPLF